MANDINLHYLHSALCILQKLFDEKWHQLRLLVTEEDITLYVDDLEIETLALEPPDGIFINGKTQVGKYVSKETTVPVSMPVTPWIPFNRPVISCHKHQ